MLNDVRCGSSAAPQNSTSPTAAIGGEADIILTVLRTIYDHNGAPDPGAARGKLTFPKLINDPVCHGAAILKSYFLKFF